MHDCLQRFQGARPPRQAANNSFIAYYGQLACCGCGRECEQYFYRASICQCRQSTMVKRTYMLLLLDQLQVTSPVFLLRLKRFNLCKHRDGDMLEARAYKIFDYNYEASHLCVTASHCCLFHIFIYTVTIFVLTITYTILQQNFECY